MMCFRLCAVSVQGSLLLSVGLSLEPPSLSIITVSAPRMIQEASLSEPLAYSI
jgi:hypothetical protein